MKQGQTIPGTKAKFDELAYYAERFDTVEINNTFYRPPAVKVAQSWAKRTPPGFEFSLKLFQDFTHKREVSKTDVDVFKRGIDPLADAGKLGALLCQFPASFKLPSRRRFQYCVLWTHVVRLSWESVPAFVLLSTRHGQALRLHHPQR